MIIKSICSLKDQIELLERRENMTTLTTNKTAPIRNETRHRKATET